MDYFSDFKNKMAKIPPVVLYILSLFIVTRVVLTVTGLLARSAFQGRDIPLYSSFPWLNVWGVWDSGWYVTIANEWYPISTYIYDYPHYAFFPLYPLLMRLLGAVIGSTYIAGLIISNVCLLISCVYIYKLVKLDQDEDTAKRSIKYLILFPTAFILSGVFTESLYLMIIIMCFYYAKKGNWALVGALGFFLTLTRSVGVAAILPLGYEYLKSKNFKIKDIKPDILFLLLIPVAMLLFMGYNYYLTGDFLAFAHIQKDWEATFANPLVILFDRLISIGDLSRNNIPFLFGAYFSLIALLALTVYIKKIGFAYWLLGVYTILIPLSAGRATAGSMPRFILTIFPLFIILAMLSKNKRIDMIAMAALCLLQLVLMVFWTNRFSLVV